MNNPLINNMENIDVSEYLAILAGQVDEALERYLPQPESYSEVITESMRYSVYGAGKRLRAALVVESAYACGGERVAAIPVATALEMIHAYSLVHDDLPSMDDDDIRRGKPSNHIVYGEGLAVLAGDALLTHAFHLLARLPELSDVSPAVTVSIIREIANASGTYGMIGGQVADLQAEGEKPDSKLLDFIHSRKTGALFRASVLGGALLANASEEQLEALSRFAHHFGVAFQIVDDLLDVEGDSEKLGKNTGSDERQGKMTFPKVYGIERSRQMAQEHIARADEQLASLGDRASVLRNLSDFVLAREV